MLAALLLTDTPRYALSKICLCLWDCPRDLWRSLRGVPTERAFTYCPSVCVVLAGHNEEDTLPATLACVWGTYPRLEIVVVDDGSNDNTTVLARAFARTHAGVKVLRRPERGGKSSAMNWALLYTRAEVIVIVDTDSHLGPNAIWEIVQPLKDPRVGAVAGAVLARNPFTNLATWLQAYEYLSTIFVGRLVTARLGILGIVSGAMGAFRRSALDQVMAWDVGPPEDLDLTLALRKAGYRISFAPYSQCYTELPTTWRGLIKQRLRWERSGVIRNHCRKHLDLSYFWRPNFHLSDLGVLFESWLFNIICMYGIWAWILWFCITLPDGSAQVLVSLYFCYLGFEVIQILTDQYYTNFPGRDLLVCCVFFLVPFYQLLLLAVRLVATTEEIFFRKSFQDNFVPLRVRKATWRW
jgi:cellulose synthase/poly-beta-1,6-N-acetylglucosamine synthase-like glycosyltransferase